MRKLLTFSLLSTAFVLQAQEQGLPHALAPHERDLIPAYRESRGGSDRGISTPPEMPVRTMAEWEEIQALCLAWDGYSPILKNIARYAKEECEVIISCDDAGDVEDYLLGNAAGGPLPDLENITFIETPFNSIWIRDYGAETIYGNEVDSLFQLDWIYNRPRPQDDALPDLIGEQLGIPVYRTNTAPYDLVHTGGNFMSDGAGTAFSSNLVLDENGPGGEFNQTVKNEAEVDAIMEQWMGIQPGRYIKMETLPYDAIHHIDMHMKLLDEERLLVGEFPLGESDGPQLETNISTVLSTTNSVFGTPWKLVRIPMPPSTSGAFPPNASYRTYANNVFINKTVLVPTYRTEYDTTGLRILRESLPGYRVIGIDCDNNEANIISASGAIHCITKGIGVADPLLIRHQPLPDTDDTENDYLVEGYIRHRSGIAGAQLHWTTDTAGGFTAVDMVMGADDHWSGAIPAQPGGTTVYYYIGAVSNSGKNQVRPIVAPEGWWRFRVSDLSTALVEGQGPEIIELYPNPASELVILTLEETRGSITVTLCDAVGRAVRNLHIGQVPSDGRLFLDVRSLPVGVYVMEVRSTSGRSVRRFLKR
ncbi:MAG TPA: agmatine deiminase family protein [Flavobacteriales bacterium]